MTDEVCFWCRESLLPPLSGPTIRCPCQCANISNRRIHVQCLEEHVVALVPERGRRQECWPTTTIRVDFECPVCRRTNVLELRPKNVSHWRMARLSIEATVRSAIDPSSLVALAKALLALLLTIASMWTDFWFLPLQEHEKNSPVAPMVMLTAPTLQAMVFVTTLRCRGCDHGHRTVFVVGAAWFLFRAVWLRGWLPDWWVREPLALLACVLLASLANRPHVIPDYVMTVLEDKQQQQ